jgi:hypothetical protein
MSPVGERAHGKLRDDLLALQRRISGEPDRVDSNHRNRLSTKEAQAAALSVGQFTLTVPYECWISTQMLDDGAWECPPRAEKVAE